MTITQFKNRIGIKKKKGKNLWGLEICDNLDLRVLHHFQMFAGESLFISPFRSASASISAEPKF